MLAALLRRFVVRDFNLFPYVDSTVMNFKVDRILTLTQPNPSGPAQRCEPTVRYPRWRGTRSAQHEITKKNSIEPLCQG